MIQANPSSPAQLYEDYFVPAMFHPWADILLRHAAPQPGESVLDLACGTGIVARLTAPQVGRTGSVTALDLNPAMLAVARTHLAHSGAIVQWQEGNAMALPFSEGSFDLVLCQHGLPFFPDPAKASREMRRVLKADGRLSAMVLQALARHPVFEALMHSVAQHLSLPVSAVMTPFAMPDADALKGLFTDAGFREVVVLQESTTVRFPDPDRFVPLAAASSAAAVPAFVQLQAPERAALLERVRADVESVLQRFHTEEAITFPMFAHVVTASS